jgi:PAS domain S-box-containing protein/diguanylate cyclase (GGDEF)-like protein
MTQAYRLILVEDSITDAELELRELRRAGLRIESTIVETEPAFREAIMEFGADVIISDYSLPHFNGMTALRIARELCPQVPFIFVSGTIGEENAVAALKNGAVDYILKNNLTRFPAAVERAIEEARAKRDREQVERALAVSEDRFRSIVESTNEWIWECDSEGRMTYNNPAVERILGYRPAELAGKPTSSLLSPEDLQQFHDNAARLRQVPEPWQGTIYRWRHRDGGTRWLESNGMPLLDDSGRLIGLRGADRDVTERILQEARLKRLSRIRNVLGSMTAAIIRIHTRDDLFRELCRIAVEVGGFSMAWVGLYDRDSNTIRPIASAGRVDGFLEAIALSLDNPDREAEAPATLAVRQRRQVVINDIAASAAGTSWQRESLARGYRSAAALPLVSADGVVGVGSLFSDETGFFDDEHLGLLAELVADVALSLDRMEKQEKLDYLSYYDALTSLANRTLFLERLQHFLHDAERSGSNLALMILDIERFHLINDSMGRGAGDQVLKLIAERIKLHHDADRIGRVGMNSFAIFIPNVGDAIQAARLVEEGRTAPLSAQFTLNGQDLRLSARCGISMFPADGRDPEVLMRNAEAALLRAKQTGDAAVYYATKLNANIALRLQLESKLQRAIDDRQFILHYQPKVSLTLGRIEAVEALIRWNDPDTGLVPPGKFVPILEETGMILDAGRWALREAAQAHRRWIAAGLPEVRIAVNVSPVQLRQKNFVSHLEDAIAGNGRIAGVDIEITESMVMQDVERIIVMLEAIQSMGVRISMDDFGTGYSSLSYLARLPIDYLKIDRSFVQKLGVSADDLEIASAIISLAKSLRLKSIAEGVESQTQADTLTAMGCDQMQGFLFSPPVPEQRIMQMLEAAVRR